MNDKKTVLLKRRQNMPSEPLPACHDGNGSVDWVGVLNEKDLENRRLRFVHDDILQPGVSVGLHKHTDDEEYYFIVSGHGTMTLNGERVKVSAGDIAAVFPGGSHAVENTGSEPMRIIVFCVNSGALPYHTRIRTQAVTHPLEEISRTHQKGLGRRSVAMHQSARRK